MGRITIKHIAEKSGFSNATVSRVLANSNYPVNPDTREAILEAAEQLEYVPNMFARGLKTSRSNEIAVVMPSIQNPFYTAMINGIENRLTINGYNMLVYLKRKSRKDDGELINSIRGKMIAGVIIASDCITPNVNKGLMMIQKDQIPVAAIDFASKKLFSFDGVFFDYRKGGQLSANYLLSKGHTDVALLTKALTYHTRISLKIGFCEIFEKAGFPIKDNDIFISNIENDFEAGKEMGLELLSAKKKYTAVAANNDAVAAGISSSFISNGIKIPNDVSIIGFDDSLFSQISTPSLTTIRVPSEEMGEKAVDFIRRELSGQQKLTSLFMEPSLVERESVCICHQSEKHKNEEYLILTNNQN